MGLLKVLRGPRPSGGTSAATAWAQKPFEEVSRPQLTLDAFVDFGFHPS